MSGAVFAAVLASACAQAGWNFAAKASRADRVALLAVGWFLQGAVLLPLGLLWSGPFDRAWLPYLLGTALVQGVYMCLLGWAYSIGEISVVFPVSRGLGVLGTACAFAALSLQQISGRGVLGILAVVAGTLLIGLKELPQRDRRAAFLAAALVAVTVSAYTVIDSLGARAVPTTLYLAGMHLLAPVAAAPYLLRAKRRELAAVWRGGKAEAFAVAAGGCLSYAIVLWAYQRAPGAYVAALREVSVVVAALLGVFALGERLYKRKMAGVGLIIAGAVLLRLA